MSDASADGNPMNSETAAEKPSSRSGRESSAAALRRWLADDVSGAMASVPGSPERSQIVELIASAERIYLEPDLCLAAAQTVFRAPGTIERNLGRLSLHQIGALWIEYPHRARLTVAQGQTGPVHGARPEAVGCLIAADPENLDHVATFVCWKLPNGEIHHSYALLHWDIGAFRTAGRAKLLGDGVNERLMALAKATVPPGFLDEMEIWQRLPRNDAEQFGKAVAATEADALGEHMFLLSALLMLESSAVDLEEEEAPEPEGSPASPVRRLARLSANMPQALPWRGPGFSEPLFGGPLRWRRP